MSEQDLSGGFPLVPAVWPLGEGVVLTSWAIEPTKRLGLYLLRGVRDELVGEAGAPAGMTTWDACEGVPTLCLAFKDVAAVERHIEAMGDLAEAMRLAALTPNPGAKP